MKTRSLSSIQSLLYVCISAALFFCTLNVQARNTGTKTLLSGPNCWNATLTATNILPYHRYVNAEEFIFYMKSPLCRPLMNQEARKYGDIGSISIKSKIPRGQDGAEHAFMYVNESSIYSKKNALSRNPFAMSSIEELFKTYDLEPDKECFLNQSAPGCEVRTTFYRCQSMDTYLAQTSTSEDLIKALRFLEEIEKQIEELVRHDRVDSMTLFKNSKIVQDILRLSPFKNENDLFLKKVFIVRLNSIDDQLRAIRDESTINLSEIEDNLKNLKLIITVMPGA